MCNDIYVYRCSICGQVFFSLVELQNIPRCCQRDVELLVPGSVDASAEHHVPVFDKCGNCVKIKIGKDPHPMTKDHHIEWVAIITNKAIHMKCFKDTDEPTASFHMDSDEEVCAIYTYCNLHRLWKCDCKME